MVIQAHPLAGAYAYRSNCNGECGRRELNLRDRLEASGRKRLLHLPPDDQSGILPLAENSIEI
jgi:hypothetical protein